MPKIATDVGKYDDPIEFLRAVMNAPLVPLDKRMEAAKIVAQLTRPQRRVMEYKGVDERMMDSVESGNIFQNAAIAAPKVRK